MNNAFLAALVLLLMTACTKNEAPVEPTPPEIPEPKPVALTKANLVGTYLITKVEAEDSSNRTDVTASWFRLYAGECSKDDVTEFKPDNSFIVMDGTIVCNESTDDTGTWDIISPTRLRWDADTTTIEAFNSTTLRIVSPIYSTAQSKLIFTYTRK